MMWGKYLHCGDELLILGFSRVDFRFLIPRRINHIVEITNSIKFSGLDLRYFSASYQTIRCQLDTIALSHGEINIAHHGFRCFKINVQI